MKRLRTYERYPPGYPDGIMAVAAARSKFRAANGLPHSAILECVAEVDAEACARLNYDPRWVIDVEEPMPPRVMPETPDGTAPVASSGCAGCGANLHAA